MRHLRESDGRCQRLGDVSEPARRLRAASGGLADAGRDVELADLDLLELALNGGRVERSRPEMLSRLRAAGHPVGEALAGRGPFVAGRDVAGEEAVPGANRRDRLERGCRDLVATALRPLADDRDAAGLARDHGLPGAD